MLIAQGAGAPVGPVLPAPALKVSTFGFGYDQRGPSCRAGQMNLEQSMLHAGPYHILPTWQVKSTRILSGVPSVLKWKALSSWLDSHLRKKRSVCPWR